MFVKRLVQASSLVTTNPLALRYPSSRWEITWAFNNRPPSSLSSLTLWPPESNKHLISPYNITLESQWRVTRIKQMIANFKKLLIVKQILLVSTLRNVWRTLGRIFILMFHHQGEHIVTLPFSLTKTIHSARAGQQENYTQNPSIFLSWKLSKLLRPDKSRKYALLMYPPIT